MAYQDTYRSARLAPFEISGSYWLFPGADTPSPKWPEPYPFTDRAGIYLIFASSEDLLYIGKASMNNSIGARLGEYFGSDNDLKTCKVKNSSGWTLEPHSFITVAVPIDCSFEAPALEEFLIKRFGKLLPDNTVGTGK